uniref:Gag polyprotein-related n=1 Tax=Medicago truncatula TaxID=3880 RepID=Q2HW79_MEDTR|nr:gag polyprotein-related [Medicago truncatula]
MAGRNDAALAAALQAVAQAVGQQPNVNAGANAEARMLETREFLRRYFPEDVRGKKEIEFLELKQGNMSVTEYAAKFVELSKFYPHYTAENAEFSRCIKFENGLRPDIKRAIGYQQLRVFQDLVNSCRIYEEDTKAHYKVVNERKGKGQ